MGTTERPEVDPVVWGRDVERRHAWLLHTSNLVVGPVDRFYTGTEGDQYKSEIDGNYVAAPVVVLGTGHALLSVDPRVFVEIGPDEATIYITTIERLRSTIVDAVTDAARALREAQKAEVAPELPMALIIAAVRAQLHALEATAKTMPPMIGVQVTG